MRAHAKRLAPKRLRTQAFTVDFVSRLLDQMMTTHTSVAQAVDARTMEEVLHARLVLGAATWPRDSYHCGGRNSW